MSAQTVNVFNVIAEIIVHLRTLDSKLFNRKDERQVTEIPADLTAEVNQLWELNPCLKNGKQMITQGLPSDTEQSIKNWPHYNKFWYLLEVLVRLTRRVKLEDIKRYSSAAKNPNGFEALNDNIDATGLLIIPKVSTINDPLEPSNTSQKHWATDRLDGINEELANIYYVEVERLRIGDNGFKVMHHIYEGSSFFENRKELILGISPIMKGDFLDVDYDTRNEDGKIKNYFHIRGLKNVETINKKVAATILAAARKGVDILIFPEMLGNMDIDSSFLNQLAKLAEDAGLPMPSLILLPTWWHDHSNELHIIDGSGECVCIQEKQFPFVYFRDETEKYYFEDLRFGKRVIHMLHIPKLGRFTFPICRDYLEPDYTKLLAESLRTTFLICSSFSKGKTQFSLSSPSDIQFGCYTIWNNSCAAYTSSGCPEYVGLIAGPTKGKYIQWLKPACNGDCGSPDTPCLFVAKITLDESTAISYKHELQ